MSNFNYYDNYTSKYSLSSRFEEIEDEKPSLSKKRPRDSDPMEVAGDDGAEGPAMTGKKEQKKLNKKLKKENGEAASSEKVMQNGDAKKEKGEKKKEKEKEKKEKEGQSKEAGLKELPSGLQIKDVKVGTGKTAKKGDVVSMRYIGKFLNGKIFDQNTKGKPVSVIFLSTLVLLVEFVYLVHFQSRFWRSDQR